MRQNSLRSLRDMASLALLAGLVAALSVAVWTGVGAPRMPTLSVGGGMAQGQLPPHAQLIRQAEIKSAQPLISAFDRIGFDLQAVAHGYVSVPRILLPSLPPDIDRLDSLDARKSLFVRALLPVILTVNEQIGEDRQHLLKLKRMMAEGRTLDADEVQWILTLADSYDEPGADLDALLRKVDVVPPSLALAQAIEESGWGTSRIARDSNALFGQFGQVGASGDWDYRSFSSLTEAVASYARNLNTHRAYREFRQARARMRGSDEGIDSWTLAGTLHRYSERGEDYVDSLRNIMRINNLENLDAARLSVSGASTFIASR